MEFQLFGNQLFAYPDIGVKYRVPSDEINIPIFIFKSNTIREPALWKSTTTPTHPIPTVIGATGNGPITFGSF